MVFGGLRGVSIAVTLTVISGSVCACSEDPPCQDAALVQVEPRLAGEQYLSCRVNIVPGVASDAASELPAYDFSNPPIFSRDPWSCPNLDIVPPIEERRECVVNSGPTPTSCFMDGGCFSLLFWEEPATELKALLGTDKFTARLDCDGLTVGEHRYHPEAPSEVVYCRNPENGNVERQSE
jgi:hypothetical protein